MKIIERNHKKYAWPDDDTELLKVFDYVRDIDKILEHVDHFDTCIQAGGACGVWPLEFAKYFTTVRTYEPDKANFECLEANTKEVKNIIAKPYGLGDVTCIGRIHEGEPNNAGAKYFKQDRGGNTSLMNIDNLNLDSCDLIQLDVEGYEYRAIIGARETIKKFSPVVVIEEKQLKHMTTDYRAAGEYLETLGYTRVGEVHRDGIYRRL